MTLIYSSRSQQDNSRRYAYPAARKPETMFGHAVDLGAVVGSVIPVLLVGFFYTHMMVHLVARSHRKFGIDIKLQFQLRI